MTDDTFSPLPQGLWTVRSVQDTLQLYADWADTYESDVATYGYGTPGRIAALLASHLADPTTPILDFGCGTGLSGLAMADAGLKVIDGSDISDEMRAKAEAKGVYRRVFPGTPGKMPEAAVGTYGAIAAVGVVSLGAAPAETLAPLLDLLAPGGFLAFSYNDATLREASYMEALTAVQLDGTAVLIAAQYGPHLPNQQGAQGSTVYLLRRL